MICLESRAGVTGKGSKVDMRTWHMPNKSRNARNLILEIFGMRMCNAREGVSNVVAVAGLPDDGWLFAAAQC
jgi:hypothetical protein